jgi:hypothetical protein
MRHVHVILTLYITMLFASAAHAGPCEEGGLAGKQLTRCNQRLKKCDRSRGSGKARCIKTALKNSLGAQQRETTRLDKAATAGAKWGICKEKAYSEACYALRKWRIGVCDPAARQPRFTVATNEPLERSVARLTGRYRAYAEGLEQMAAFVKNYGHCDKAPPDRRPTCTFDSKYQAACKGAQAKFKASWAAYIDSFAKNDLPRMLKEIERLKRKKTAPTFMWNYHVDAPLQVVEELVRVNKAFSWIAVPEAKLVTIEQRVRDNHKKMRQTIEKIIAAVRCPVKEKGGKYFNITVKHLADTKGPGSTMKETVKRLGITGKSFTLRNPFLRLTHQNLPGQMCVKQVRKGTTACRVFRMHFRRTKPDGGAWGAWGFYSIAGGQLMSCKNLK